MKKLFGLCFILNGWIAFSQPVSLDKFNFDYFTVRNKNHSPEFSKLIPAQFLNHPEIGIMPFDAPPGSNCIELIDRRDANSRYFVRENTMGSEFFQQVASGPINYKDINGVWREINYRLSKKGDKLFVANHQPHPVSIDLERKIISLQNSKFKIISNFPELIWQEDNGIEHSLGTPDLKDFTAGDDGVRINNFYSGVDLVLTVRQGEVETNFVLNKRLPYISGNIILRQQIVLPENLFFSLEKSEGHNYQELYITDKGKVHNFIVEEGFAFDSGTLPKPLKLKSNVTEDKFLEFYIPVSWLSNPATHYPILIDPKIRTQNTIPLTGLSGTKFSPVCWTNGCDYPMNVNTPPGATVTKIYHSFEFYATGLCFAEDGGYSIDFLTCHAPANAPGVFTNPVQISNAYFTADTVLISEFNSCIPPPQCAPQNFNFILHFYRCNNDPDLNCAGNCIRATKPWTMFIEGYTLQLSYITPTQQLCDGANSQLVVTPQYGVTPYSYLWSPGGSTNDTIIVSPNVTTTYSVTVTDICGTTTTGSTLVNVIANNNPGFNIIPNPVCINSSVTLNGNGAGSANDYDWTINGSNVPGGILNDIQSPVISYSLPGNYDVILSYANGVCSFNDTIPITVSAVSIVSVSLSAQPSIAVCLGDTVTFKANPINGGLSPTYEWLVDGINVQNGPSDSLVTNALVNGSLVQVILHSSSSCAATLTDTASFLVNLNTGVSPGVTITPDTALCPGSPLTLNAISINGGASPAYQWFANGIPVAGATSSSYSFFISPPDTIISVQLNSSLGCLTSVVANDFTTINILQNLVTAVVINANPPGIVCAGDSIHYSTLAQNGGINPSYQWFVNGILTSNTDSVFSIMPSNNDSIGVQLTSSISCVLNSTGSDYKIAIVSPSLSPSVSLSVSPGTNVCQGDTLIFTASAKNAGSFPLYSWSVNGNSVNVNDSIFSTSTLNNNDNVRIILNSSLACASTTSDTDNVIITVLRNNFPSLTISSVRNVNCEGDSLQFFASAINGGLTPSFQWFVNGIATGINNDTVVIGMLTNGDTIRSVMTSSMGCAFPSNATLDYYVSDIQPKVNPQINISVLPADTVCVGQEVNVKANILNGGNSPVIRWFVNSIQIPEKSLTLTSTAFRQGDMIVAEMISNANCLIKPGDTSNFVRIVYYQPVNVYLTSGIPDCPGSPATINAHVSGGNGGPYHIIWSNGSIDNDSIIISPDRNTTIFIQAEDNCTIQPATFSFTVPVLSSPIADFAYVNPSPGSFQNNIQFINLSKHADSWLWIFPETNTTSTELNPLHQFTQQGIYDVMLATRSNDGCVDTVIYKVSVQEEIAVFYPNSFSPNGDGKNDSFQPLGASLEDYEMTIWDRWGELIYYGSSKSAWNGMIRNTSSPAQEGVYIFRIDLKEAKFVDKVVTGRVTLVR